MKTNNFAGATRVLKRTMLFQCIILAGCLVTQRCGASAVPETQSHKQDVKTARCSRSLGTNVFLDNGVSVGPELAAESDRHRNKKASDFIDELLLNACPGPYFVPKVVAFAVKLCPHDFLGGLKPMCSGHVSLMDVIAPSARCLGLCDETILQWSLARARACNLHRIPNRLTITLAGYFTGAFGLGESARILEKVFKHGPLSTVDVKTLPLLHDNGKLAIEPEASTKYDQWPSHFNIIHANADQWVKTLDDINQRLSPANVDMSINIAIWYWEMETFPASKFRNSFRSLSEIWVASRFIERALAPVSPVPVRRIITPPPNVMPSDYDWRLRYGIKKTATLFFFNFDYRSFHRRKNPEGALAAFNMAFTARDNAAFILKSSHALTRCAKWLNGSIHHSTIALNRKNASGKSPASFPFFISPSNLAHWRSLMTKFGSPQVHFINEILSEKDMSALFHACDCYVSLHRSEGLGVGLQTAMSIGKPVIATAYSGNVDFTTPETSLLVNYTLQQIGQNWGPYEAHFQWAEPDVGHAASHMLRVHRDKNFAHRLGNKGKLYLAREYSYKAAAHKIHHRLSHFHRL